MKKLTILFLCSWIVLTTQARKVFQLNSPDGHLNTTITIGEQLTYDIKCNGKQVLAASPLSMTLENGTVWGDHPQLTSSSRKEVDQLIDSPFYRSSQLRDHYKKLVLCFRKGWSVEFRAYNDGIAYRFVNQMKKPFKILQEEVNYQLPLIKRLLCLMWYRVVRINFIVRLRIHILLVKFRNWISRS